MQKELSINNSQIVSGDTKVVPKGSVDKIFINTSGVGKIIKPGISSNLITEEDLIIVSGPIGRHGAAIYSNREGIELSSGLKSDCASLWPTVHELIKNNIEITALRDATRGGLAAVLNEWANQSNICIEIEESTVPISTEVRGICELLGFDAFYLANEGTFVIAVKNKDASRAIELLKKQEIARESAIIGKVSDHSNGKIILHSNWGTSRFLEAPTGELLPRIC
jgi:hydrogenase expression/formation protein HypE